MENNKNKIESKHQDLNHDSGHHNHEHLSGSHLNLAKTPKSRILRRLKIIEGQVRGLQDMVLKNVYCIDVITQTSAVKQALSSIEDAMMEDHLSTCVVPQIKEGKGNKATKEILEVYRLKRK